MEPGAVVGTGGEGTQGCAAGKFGSVCEDFVVHSHETHFLSLDFCPGRGGVGFKGKTSFSFLVTEAFILVFSSLSPCPLQGRRPPLFLNARKWHC